VGPHLRGSSDLVVRPYGSAASIARIADGRYAIDAVALSADGRFAVSGGHDGAIRVFALESGRCLYTLTGHGSGVHTLALSPDCHLLMSAGYDGMVRVWELDWEYDFPAAADWDERARPQLEAFLAAGELLHPGGAPAPEDRDRLAETLERVGFGWLRRSTAEAELERMWAAAHRGTSLPGMRFATSLLLAWNVAATEAAHGNAPQIELAHLLMGLTKVCELDDGTLARATRVDGEPPETLAQHVDELRASFERIAVDPKLLRRRLRVLAARAPRGGAPAAGSDGVMHRDLASRRAFDRAAAIAAETARRR